MAVVSETIGGDVSAVHFKKSIILNDVSRFALQGVFLLLMPERMSLFGYAARHFGASLQPEIMPWSLPIRS
jgi:hypothetical protein